MRKILLVGGGGYCKQVINILEKLDQYDRIGIVEKQGCEETTTAGYEIVGYDEDLPELFRNGWDSAIVTVGSVGNTQIRRKAFQTLQKIGFTIPSVVDPTAQIARTATIGEGSIIHQLAVLDADACVGACSIINKGSILSHDCRIGDFVHVSPGCILLGNVTVGNDSHIGAGATVREGISIGNDVMIGMASVVVKDIADSTVAFGNPCKVVREK